MKKNCLIPRRNPRALARGMNVIVDFCSGGSHGLKTVEASLLFFAFLCCGFLPALSAYSQNICADAKKDKALVVYELPTSSGEYIYTEVLYSGEAKNSSVENVDFYLKESLPDGEHVYYLVDKDGSQKIKVVFFVQKQAASMGQI